MRENKDVQKNIADKETDKNNQTDIISNCFFIASMRHILLCSREFEKIQKYTILTGMKYIKKHIHGAELSLYILSNYQEIDINRKRPMIVICPGGGYHYCSPREAEAIAVKFMSYGYNAAVLIYTTADDFKKQKMLYPKPQQQLAKTIEYIRKNADCFNTNPNMICTIGFSAGGHLVASIGCFWKHYGEMSRPDAQVLCYPVITSGKYAHRGSFDNLCFKDENLIKQLSLENCVNPDVPPTFIWHTKTDQSVPCKNSELFIEALKKNKVKVQSHFFEEGSHGLSLATNEVLSKRHPEVNKDVAKWPDLVHKWIDKTFKINYSN